MLDEELLNFICNEVRSTMQKGKVRLTSRWSLSNKKNDSVHEGFTIKWNDTDMDKDGCKIDVELENHGCEVSCIYGIQ